MTAPTPRRVAIAEGAAVLGIALAVRLAGIGQNAGGDELYHILAAKQYLLDGTLGIHGAEPYTRGKAFTLLVALCFRIFGESPEAARIPSLVAGSLTAAVVFAWLRSLGERGGAWVAGLLVALDPELVKLSQWARFYTIQHLAFLVGAIAVHTATYWPLRPRRLVPLAAIAALSFWLALHLQVITEIGLVGVILFAALVAMPRLRERIVRGPHGALVALGGLVAVAIAFLAVYRMGFVAEARTLAVEVDLWSVSRAANWRFYHALLQEAYPTLWPLFPVALLVCALRQGRLALLCGSVFVLAFTAHSFVALKHVRYLGYAFPFLFVPCGVAIARSAAALASRLEASGIPRSLPAATRRALAWTAIGVAAAFAIAANPAFVRTARLVAMDPTLRQPGMEHEGLSWRRAAEALRPLAASAEVVVSADDLPTLYYLGRLDYVVSATQLDLEKTGREFTPDPSVGAPIFTTPESLAKVMACHASGLFVGRTWALETDWAVPRATALFLERNAERVPLPAAWGIEAFTWRRAAPADDPGCAALPRRRAGGASR